MEFKKRRYITILLYIVSKCMNKPNLGKTVLSYLLYFADFNYYELYGKSITNETYKKSKKGLIISTHFDKVIKELVRYNLLYTRKEDYFQRRINRYYITKFVNIELSYLEYSIIEDVISKYADFSAKELSEYACKDSPYAVAGFGDNLEYFYVNYRDETSVNYLHFDFFRYG